MPLGALRHGRHGLVEGAHGGGLAAAGGPHDHQPVPQDRDLVQLHALEGERGQRDEGGRRQLLPEALQEDRVLRGRDLRGGRRGGGGFGGGGGGRMSGRRTGGTPTHEPPNLRWRKGN